MSFQALIEAGPTFPSLQPFSTPSHFHHISLFTWSPSALSHILFTNPFLPLLFNTADKSSSTYKHVTSSFRTHILENGTLFIDDVQKSDSGLYLCRASNGIGTDLSKVIRVSVHGKFFLTLFWTSVVQQKIKLSKWMSESNSLSRLLITENLRPGRHERMQLICSAIHFLFSKLSENVRLCFQSFLEWDQLQGRRMEIHFSDQILITSAQETQLRSLDPFQQKNLFSQFYPRKGVSLIFIFNTPSHASGTSSVPCWKR